MGRRRRRRPPRASCVGCLLPLVVAAGIASLWVLLAFVGELARNL